MASSVYFKNCIREIRHTIYGRDNRKPIADAIQQIDSFSRNYEIPDYAKYAILHCNALNPVLSKMEQKLQRAIGAFTPEPMETQYTYDYRDMELRVIQADDYSSEIVTDQMSVELEDTEWGALDISWNEADFSWDNPSGNTENYILFDDVTGDSAQVISGDEDSYLWVVPNPIKETHIHYGEDYILTISRMNGQ